MRAACGVANDRHAGQVHSVEGSARRAVVSRAESCGARVSGEVPSMRRRRSGGVGVVMVRSSIGRSRRRGQLRAGERARLRAVPRAEQGRSLHPDERSSGYWWHADRTGPPHLGPRILPNPSVLDFSPLHPDDRHGKDVVPDHLHEVIRIALIADELSRPLSHTEQHYPPGSIREGSDRFQHLITVLGHVAFEFGRQPLAPVDEPLNLRADVARIYGHVALVLVGMAVPLVAVIVVEPLGAPRHHNPQRRGYAARQRALYRLVRFYLRLELGIRRATNGELATLRKRAINRDPDARG